MNKQEALRRLRQYLSGILYCVEILAELLEIIQETGKEDRFFKQLIKFLRIIAVKGLESTRLTGFEHLEGGIYSMRFEGVDMNIRILYAFMPDHRPVLLHAFYERAGKKATDYTDKISLAQDRLQSIKEEQK